MATEVIMPKAGMAMETGQIIRWLKSVGDYVEQGEPLLEIETDKVSMEVEAEVSGYLLATTRNDGDTVPVIETIGYLGEQGEEVPSAVSSAGAKRSQENSETSADQAESPKYSEVTTSGSPANETKSGDTAYGRVRATPAARRIAAERGVTLASVSPRGPHGEVRAADVRSFDAGRTGGAAGRAASSLAAKIAADSGLEIADVHGSGPGGRVLRADIIQALSDLGGGTTEFSEADHRKPMSGMRKTISRRMLESHLSIPPVTLNAKVGVDRLVAIRTQLNQSLDRKISLSDFIVKASAKALVEHPQLRTAIDGDSLIERSEINVGIAVAVDNGLLVPVIHGVDQLPLSALAAQSRSLATRARNGEIRPDELSGGTFTVTNLGMFGIHSFTPIVNPPQSAILGVNTIEDELTRDAESGEIRERKTMMFSLTIDHRVVDGAAGAAYLQTLRGLLEAPMTILV